MWLTITEAAARYRVNQLTIRRLVRLGRVATERRLAPGPAGFMWVVDSDDLDRIAQERGWMREGADAPS